MMLNVSRTLLSLIFLASATASSSADSSKEDAARQLLQKSYRQSNIWNQGPVQLTATVRLMKAGKQPLELTYTISWVGADKWRAEWSGAGYSRVIVANNGKLYRYSSTPVPPLPIMAYEGALNTLNDAAMYRPLAAIPDLQNVKRKSEDKIGKVKAECITRKGLSGSLCIDPVSAQARAWHSEDYVFEYSDYGALGESIFPRTIQQTENGRAVQDSNIIYTVNPTFSDSLFTPPANAVASDFPACREDNTLQTPSLEKKVTPVYPQTATMNRH
jgi:hypothetical protein